MSSDDSDHTELLGDDRHGATLDSEREYRYRLWRTWDADGQTIAFVMLNPSTADEADDDPTLRRCIGYATDWGYGRLEVVNLFALRATDPDQLREHPNPVGVENDVHLRTVCRDAEKVIAAWGANGGLRNRASEVAALLDADLHALDTTVAGHPVHPLYQPSDAEPEPWNIRTVQMGGEGR